MPGCKILLEAGVDIRVGSAGGALLREGERVTACRRYRTTQTLPCGVEWFACGGFPHDDEPNPGSFPTLPTATEHLSPASSGNTGDGISSGLKPAPSSTVTFEFRRLDSGFGSALSERGERPLPHLIDRYKPVSSRTEKRAPLVTRPIPYHMSARR